MRGVNKAIIVGLLGKDPEVRYTAEGKAIANFSVATTEQWKNAQGEKQERTEWHRIAIFGKLAEIAGEYLRKGSQVYLEGKIQTRKWQDKDGQDRYTTEIVADQMQMLGGKRDAEEKGEQNAGQSSPSKGQDDFDDDIPF